MKGTIVLPILAQPQEQRADLAIALEELLARCPDFQVDLDAVVYAPGPYVRRPTSVPFRVS